jgi:Cu-processing system permease protein
MTAVLTVAGYGLREALRRKVFAVVLVLTLGFLVLYWIANRYTFDHLEGVIAPQGLDPRTFAGAFLLGLAMFATLFLGVVLAIFLTLGVVRGDAERGLLQPLVVRPIGRPTVLAARFLGAAAVCAPYTVGVYLGATAITGLVGGWWPGRILVPGLELAAGVLLVAAVSLLGSIFLSTIANGIAVFMLFGAGLVGGLLDTIAHALGSHGLLRAARVVAWALPFEALYQDALHGITIDARGLTAFALRLGPFGGTEAGGATLPFWALAYFGLVAVVAMIAFARRDL